MSRCYIQSREALRQRYAQRQNIRNKTGIPLHVVSDNSEPWGPPPRTVAEALAISDQVARLAEEMRRKLPSK